MRAEGLPQAVIEAVDSLTKRDGKDYDEFIQHVGPSPLSRGVKLADPRDHCDLSRIAQVTRADVLRIERYGRTIKDLAGPG